VDGENDIIMNFVTCDLHYILSRPLNEEGYRGGGSIM
jgi:hypothetical protein